MKDFIIKLYQNESFPIYLGVIIAILLVAFFVIYFLGKKDKKKIEATQKLETVTDNAFKDNSTVVPVEVAAPINTQPEIAPVVETPVIEPVQMPNEVPSIPIIDAPLPEMTPEIQASTPAVEIIPTQTVVNEIPVVEPPVIDVMPVIPETPVSLPPENLSPVVEPPVKEPAEPDVAYFDELASSIEKELTSMEQIKEIKNIDVPISTPILSENIVSPVEIPIVKMPQVEPIAVPEVDTSKPEPAPQTKVVSQVYSSVYVPKKEEIIEDETEIELPKLKEEPILKDEEESLKL